MSDRKTIIRGCENWVNNHKDENLLLAYSSVVELLTLLKEQEAVEPINSYGTFRCGNCGNIVGYNDGYECGYQNNFCSKCGKAVKWNIIHI